MRRLLRVSCSIDGWVGRRAVAAALLCAVLRPLAWLCLSPAFSACEPCGCCVLSSVCVCVRVCALCVFAVRGRRILMLDARERHERMHGSGTK